MYHLACQVVESLFGWHVSALLAFGLLSLQRACVFAFDHSGACSCSTGFLKVGCFCLFGFLLLTWTNMFVFFCALAFAQCAFVTHRLHWLSVYMMACSVPNLLAQFALVFVFGTLIARLHRAWLSWTVACSVDVSLVWVALLLTQLAFLVAQGVVYLSSLQDWREYISLSKAPGVLSVL